jgi:integrase
MAGCRAFTKDEEARVLAQFKGAYQFRNTALFVFCTRTGFRISEALSLQVQDVYQFGEMREEVTITRRFMKGKQRSRTVPLHRDAKAALCRWLQVLKERMGTLDPGMPVFISRSRRANGTYRAISRMQAWRLFKAAFTACEMRGKLATHSCRKSFGMNTLKVFNGDVFKVSKAMGHSSIGSTQRYLEADMAEIYAGILAA